MEAKTVGDITNIFKSLAELRLLLTSNFNVFLSGENKLNDVMVDWNGLQMEYEFKCSTVDFWANVNYMGLPTFGIRGKIEDSYKTEFITDSIYEIITAINNKIISYEQL